MATQTARRSRTQTASRSRNGGSDATGDTDRYRRAAEDALQQLDWAIGYLHGIRKTNISRALAKNRSSIRKRLLGQDEQALPGQQTNEN